MKYILTSLACILGIAFSGFAQEQDPAAKKILDDLSSTFKGYNSVKVEFKSTIQNNEQGLDVSSKGSMLLKGKKYRIETEEKTIICDGLFVYVVAPEEGEAYKNDMPDESEYGIDPTNIFNVHNDKFKYVLESQSGSTAVIKLFPKDAKTATFHTITLTVDTGKNQIKKAVIKGKEGNVYTYTILQFVPNPSIPDSKLRFRLSDWPTVSELTDLTEG